MESWTLILSCVLVLISIYLYKSTNYYYFKRLGIPYMNSWPILGCFGSMLFYKSLAEFAIDWYNRYPKAKYIGFFETTKPALMIRDPELIKLISVKNFDYFPQHPVTFDEKYDILFGKNLFSLKDDQWKENRTMLTPAFTLSKLKGMFKLMNDCATDFTDYLYNMSDDERTIEMKDVLTRFTNDVIATCAFGITINSMKHPNNEFYLLGREATSFGAFKTLRFFLTRSFPWIIRIFNIKFISDKVANYFTKIVEDVVKTRDENNIIRPDVIQLMMESRNKKAEMGIELPLIDIVAHAFSFFFSGFDGIASAMCFTVHEICVNLDIQKRLQKDIDEIIDKTNGNLTFDDINNMNYLNAVIKESLRRYPIIVAHDRQCVKDFELPPTLPNCEPFVVKKGMNVMFPVHAIHHDSKYYEDPFTFNPERFMEHEKDFANSGVYFPFGSGPRMCIAHRFALLEIKVLVFHLLARCNLKPCSKTVQPIRLSKYGLHMNSKDGFWICLEKRNDVHPFLKKLLNE